MENQTVTHSTVNGKYFAVIEKVGSATKGTKGWKIQVASDSKEELIKDLKELQVRIEDLTNDED